MQKMLVPYDILLENVRVLELKKGCNFNRAQVLVMKDDEKKKKYKDLIINDFSNINFNLDSSMYPEIYVESWTSYHACYIFIERDDINIFIFINDELYHTVRGWDVYRNRYINYLISTRAANKKYKDIYEFIKIKELLK